MAGPFRRRRKMKRMAHLGGGKTSKRKKKGSQSPRPGWNDSVYGIGNKYPTHESNIRSTFGVHMKWDELINNPGKWSNMLDYSEHMCYQEQSKRRNLKKKKGTIISKNLLWRMNCNVNYVVKTKHMVYI